MKERLSQRLKIYTAVSSIWCLTKQRLVESIWLRCLYCRITDWLNEFVHPSKTIRLKIRLTKKKPQKMFWEHRICRRVGTDFKGSFGRPQNKIPGFGVGAAADIKCIIIEIYGLWCIAQK